MPIKPEKMIRLLKKNGFIEKSRHNKNGTSHIYFENPETGRHTTVPFHKGRELAKGTQEVILKQAGLGHIK